MRKCKAKLGLKLIEGLPVLDYNVGFDTKAELDNCPFCGSEDVGGYTGAECEVTFWAVPCRCNACGGTWDIVLIAGGIADLQAPEEEE